MRLADFSPFELSRPNEDFSLETELKIPGLQGDDSERHLSPV